MADITYTVNQDDPNNIPGFENYSQSDLNLLSEYQVNNLFDTNKHFIELYITDLNGEIIETDTNYKSYKLLGTAQSAGREGASILTINPIEDSKTYGYGNGGVKLLYHFLNDLYTQDKTTTQFYITNISPDRTEIQLQNLELTNEQLVSYTTPIKDKLSSQSYFNEFRLDFGDNDLLIGINIDNLLVGENQTVVVKLYEPLPATYSDKSTLSILEVISDSVAFEIEATYSIPEEPTTSLRPANFNLDLTDSSVVPTGYLDYNDLFSYPVSNKNNQLYSLVNEKGAELSIDHTEYSDFVHFSSAYERLLNFKYKIQLIQSYNTTISSIQSATSQSMGTTGSVRYYENLVTGIVDNFDHYERYLYYESSSNTWPKSNTTRPYNNYSTTSSQAVNWYANQLAAANKYDLSNGNLLTNTIPPFLRDDPSNENYLTFIHMVGQHFDNLWIYGKAVTDKYDADNRLNFGISKDLVGEALRNFGIKLYTSNNSIEDLFGSFIGQPYQSGSEVINHYITGSLTGSNTPIQPVAYDDYNKEVQKRIYHNLSHLLKTKGTERGLRALINCFGISPDILKIKQYGGRSINQRPFFGDYQPYTSSLDKIRLDNTGSIISGSTLSSYTSIIKRDDKYTDDLHAIEVGFSPVDNIDNYIVSNITASFDLDDYIGDPSDLTLASYSGLTAIAQAALSGSQVSGSYDLQDYVRLIKFYDNTIFKMIKDFIPARVVADTGIILKPNLLNISKAKSVIISGSRPELSGSIDTAFIESGDGGVYDVISDGYITSYVEQVITPIGPSIYYGNNGEQPKYNGELGNSGILVTDGNLTANNIYTDINVLPYAYGGIVFVSSSNETCIIRNNQNTLGTPYIITSSTHQINASDLFQYTGTAPLYASSSNTSSGIYYPITFPITLGNRTQGSTFYISASNTDIITPCTTQVVVRFATCSLSISSTGIATTTINATTVTDLTTWFNVHPDQLASVQYTASYSGNNVGIANSGSFVFNTLSPTPTFGDIITIKVNDPLSLAVGCTISKDVAYGLCTLGRVSTGSTGMGLEVALSKYMKTIDMAPADSSVNAEQYSSPLISYIAPYAGTGTRLVTRFLELDGDLSTYGIQTGAPSPNIIPNIDPSISTTVPSSEIKGRGIQSYFTPYRGLTEDIRYDVFAIYQRSENTLASYVNNTDEYRAEIVYSCVQPGTTTDYENQLISTDTLTTILGYVPATDLNQNSQFYNPWTKPVPFATAAYNKSIVYVGNTEPSMVDYTEAEVRLLIPVAYTLQAYTVTYNDITNTFSPTSCKTQITVYPASYTVTSPTNRLQMILNPAAQSNMPPLYYYRYNNTTTKYAFYDKLIGLDYDQVLFGPSPQGASSSITVPIRKRIKR